MLASNIPLPPRVLLCKYATLALILTMPDAIVISDSETEEEEDDVLEAEREQGVKRARATNGSSANMTTNGSATRDTKGKDRAGPASMDVKEENAAPTMENMVTSSAQQQQPSLASLFGDANERKKLEQERRERQKARRRAQGLKSESDESGNEAEGSVAPQHRNIKPLPSASSSSSSRSYVTEVPEQRSSSTSSQHSMRSVPILQHASSSRTTSGLGSSAGTKPALRRILADDRFFEGTIRRSYNQYTKDGVPFSDFILPTTKSNPAGLTHALIGSYVYDFDWLHTILPDQTAATAGRKSGPPPTLTFIAPQGGTSAGQKLDEGAIYAMQAPGWALLGSKDIGREYVCMHMKFLLLLYPDRFRLVILTGNLIAYDWETLENAAYIQDFPILPGGRRDTSTDTYEQLSNVMKSLSVPSAHPALKDLSRYDLSKGPTIVASGATPSNAPRRGFEQINKWGIGRLAHCARSIMGVKGSKGCNGVHLEAQGSSMGTYSLRWMQQMHLAASGADISACLPLPSSAVQARKTYDKYAGNPPLTSASKDSWPPVKILFPTRRFVEQQSNAGPAGGGCHFGKPKKFQPFAHLCHQAQSMRNRGNMMHQKGLLAVTKSDKADNKQPCGWIYLGSANFTMNGEWRSCGRSQLQ